jgi:hypothetical protein
MSVGRGNVLRHDCSELLDARNRPSHLGLVLGGSLWRCPECEQVWVYTTDNVGWCGWVPGKWWSKLRAKIGGI